MPFEKVETQVDFPAQKTRQLDIAVRLNIDADGIEIRQLLSRRIFLPVIGITLQGDALAGLARIGHERPRGHNFFRVGRAAVSIFQATRAGRVRIGFRARVRHRKRDLAAGFIHLVQLRQARWAAVAAVV